ncbi:DUF1538 domain-containing protein [Erysipelothrix urinaevulpis]
MPLEGDVLLRFIIGAIFIIIGLGIFLLGADLGVVPIGHQMGRSIAKSNKVWIVGVLGFILGFLITVAEPDLQILAKQVETVSNGALSSWLIVIVVSIGVGIMVAFGLLRILFSKKLNHFFLIAYLFIFVLAFGVSESFLAISVDASGATTGAMTTPFILALGYGVSQLKGGAQSEEDSFGMVGLASAGPIFMVMLLSRFAPNAGQGGVEMVFETATGILTPFLENIPHIMKESLWSLLPLTLLFLLFNRFVFKLKKRKTARILKGLVYTYFGLSLFLIGVNAGFMDAGRVIGQALASMEKTWILPLVGFLLGMVVVLAEPAVYVLTEQVEEVTSGHIKKNMILITLSIGIALAVLLSMLRIMTPSLKLWHMLLPGFALAIFLSFKVPPLFVGIAFDSGGVASGPMTATFVMAFAQGAALAIPTADVMIDGFGVIAMIAMMPIVSIQILGYFYQRKQNRLEGE